MSLNRVTNGSVVVSLLVWAALAAPSESTAQIAIDLRAIQRHSPVVGEIAFVGLRRISPRALTSKIASHPGMALDEGVVEADVRTLARLGWFEDVRAEAAEVEPSSVSDFSSHTLRLTFYLPELPFLTGVEFTGSRLLSRPQIDKLLADKKLTPKLGEPEDVVSLHHAGRELESALADLGHPYASVELRRKESARATVDVRFQIHDGPHVPVARVTFRGHPQVNAKLLRRQMQRIAPGAWFANLRGKDSFTQDRFEEDRARLLAFYQNHGYPDARIGAAQVWEYQERPWRWLPWPHKIEQEKLTVLIPVEAGAFYRTTSTALDVTVARAMGISAETRTAQLRSVMGHAYSGRVVEDLRRAVEMRVRANAKKQGLNAGGVETIRTIDPEKHSVRIRFDLNSTPAYTVRRLEFRGMKRFPDRYFRRRIGLKEGVSLDERALEAGLARLARTGYFKPIKKDDIRIEPNDAARSVDIVIHLEELGQQRISMIGGRGQFGSTLGIAYSLFNLFDREELLTSKIEGGPESLQLAIGLAKEGFLGSRGSLALSVFDMFLRPMLTGTVKGPFFQQRSEGVSADYSYAPTTRDVLTASYGLSYSDTSYSPAASGTLDALASGDVHAKSSSRSVALGWTRNIGNEQMVLADSVSGGWLGGTENLVRSKAEYGRIFHDPFFNAQNAWAFRTTFSGAGSYSGGMPPTARWYAGDEFVRGLRDGGLGPQAIISPVDASGTARYSTAPAGANLIAAGNAEYRVRFGGGAEGIGFFDLGSGWLQQNWLGYWRPAVIHSTNGVVHGSTGMELRWTLPGVGVPLRAYYAWNVLRLNRSLLLPDRSLLHLRNPVGAFGWGLGSLF